MMTSLLPSVGASFPLPCTLALSAHTHTHTHTRKQDPNYLATIMADSAKTYIIDIRKPSATVAELGEHNASVNAIAWAPHSACHVCTCGDDRQALIWDLSVLPGQVESPILAYTAEAEVNSLEWFQQNAERNWVAIAFDNKMQILRV